MSNALAIAATTDTLRKLLKTGLDAYEDIADIQVTARPPDKARDGYTDKFQINLFMYHTTLNGAWRNLPSPDRSHPNEAGRPPLPLNLHYLLTAYEPNNNEILTHVLLGRAMRILHDYPTLSRDLIRASVVGNTSGVGLNETVDLQLQIDWVHVTPEGLSVDDMYKIWSTFQTQYRISAAYEACLVLIEGNQPGRSPLPVLRRGEQDQGPEVHPDLNPTLPTLTSVGLPENKGRQPAALPTDSLILQGFHLDGTAAVIFSNTHLSAPLTVAAGQNTNDRVLQVTVPDSPVDWIAGFYTLS
ncbi:MAG TPA: DUF4255 domain-containing protein, partial [Aggregatilineaceae bacterium]|nr:DUF4255 domain-containing protein [Aggregatilineaceae bacterium]